MVYIPRGYSLSFVARGFVDDAEEYLGFGAKGYADTVGGEVRDGVVPLGIELQGDFPELIPDELMPEDVAEIWFYAEDGLDYSGMVSSTASALKPLTSQR